MLHDERCNVCVVCHIKYKRQRRVSLPNKARGRVSLPWSGRLGDSCLQWLCKMIVTLFLTRNVYLSESFSCTLTTLPSPGS